MKSDGSIWFTDPPFGILGNYEGERAEPELPQAVYRIDASGEVTVVADDILGPNGLCFSPDERLLYIVESRGQPHRKILAYDVSADGRTISGKRVLIDAGPGGTPDGMRCDVDGNLWCGWGMGSAELDGVLVFAPDGTKIGRIALPERCANVCFGGHAAQPPVHGGEPVDLRALRQHPGCCRRLTRGPRAPAVPELPDVTVYIEALDKRDRRAAARRRCASPAHRCSRLRGRRSARPRAGKVLRLRRIGKRIAIGLEGDLWLVLHLMIAGRLHWRERGAKLARKIALAGFDFRGRHADADRGRLEEAGVAARGRRARRACGARSGRPRGARRATSRSFARPCSARTTRSSAR